MLEVVAVDGVEDPIEAEDGVEDHGGVVDPWAFVPEHVPQEGVFGVRVAQTWERVNGGFLVEGGGYVLQSIARSQIAGLG